MNDELKAKYNRISNDPSQLEMFKNDQIDAITILQDALDGKIGFDGLVKLTHPGGDFAIASADFPTKTGVYLLYYNNIENHYGIGAFTITSGICNAVILFNNTIYSAIYHNMSSNFVLNSSNKGCTTLYRHTIELDSYPTINSIEMNVSTKEITVTSSTPGFASKSLTIFTNKPSKYASLNEIGNDTGKLSGYFILGTGTRYYITCFPVGSAQDFKCLLSEQVSSSNNLNLLTYINLNNITFNDTVTAI